jgi:hypothetical protein
MYKLLNIRRYVQMITLILVLSFIMQSCSNVQDSQLNIQLKFLIYENNTPDDITASDLSVCIIGDSIIAKTTYGVNYAPESYDNLFQPYKGIWDELKHKQQISRTLSPKEISLLKSLSDLSDVETPYTNIPDGNFSFTCKLFVNNKLAFYVHDCHMDTCPDKLIELYCKVMELSGLTPSTTFTQCQIDSIKWNYGN